MTHFGFTFFRARHAALMSGIALCALLPRCGSAGNEANINTAAITALLTAPPCPGRCYDFSDMLGLNIGLGLSLANGSVGGSGSFTVASPLVPTPTTTLNYQITFTLQPGGWFKLHFGNPAGGSSDLYFDATSESNAFFIKEGGASQALDKIGTVDTMPAVMTPQARQAVVFCFQTHAHASTDPLHMMAWSNCSGALTSTTSAYNSGDSSKGGTSIKPAGTLPVSGGYVGFTLANAAIDRVVLWLP